MEKRNSKKGLYLKFLLQIYCIGKIMPTTLITHHRSWLAKQNCVQNWFETTFDGFECKFDQTLPTRNDAIVYKQKCLLHFLTVHLIFSYHLRFFDICMSFSQLSRSVVKYFQDQKAKEMRAEKEESVRLVRIASSIAKEIRLFWGQVEKVRIITYIV